MSNPGGAENTAVLLDLPLRCGDVDLWRLNFAGSFWLEKHSEWWPGDDLMLFAGTIYALAHCRDNDAFDRLYDPGRAKRAITKWMNRQRPSVESFAVVAEHLMPQPKYDRERDGEAIGFGPMMSMLLCEIGHTPEFWLVELSVETECEILDGLASIKWSEHGDPKKQNPFDPYIKACKQWHYFTQDLLRRREVDPCRN